MSFTKKDISNSQKLNIDSLELVDMSLTSDKSNKSDIWQCTATLLWNNRVMGVFTARASSITAACNEARRQAEAYKQMLLTNPFPMLPWRIETN